VRAPREQLGDPRVVALGLELDRAVGQVADPAGEPAVARFVDGERPKRHALNTAGHDRSYPTHREQNVAWQAALCAWRLSDHAATGHGDQLIA